MSKRRGGKFAIGTLVAVGVGYVAGLLTAPKSGRETRQDLGAAAAKAKAESEKTLKKLYGELSKTVDQVLVHAKKTKTSAKTGLDSVITEAQAALKTAGELLSAVREGEADNEQLQKAIVDAKKAKQSLSKYLSSAAKK